MHTVSPVSPILIYIVEKIWSEKVYSKKKLGETGRQGRQPRSRSEKEKGRYCPLVHGVSSVFPPCLPQSGWGGCLIVCSSRSWKKCITIILKKNSTMQFFQEDTTNQPQISTEEALGYTLDFGKHQGESLQTLCLSWEGRGYLKYLLSTDPAIKQSLVYSTIVSNSSLLSRPRFRARTFPCVSQRAYIVMSPACSSVHLISGVLFNAKMGQMRQC